MKKFIVFVIISFVVISAVFIYAQYSRKRTIFADPYQQKYFPKESTVLGLSDTSTKLEKNNTPITIKIDKNPVFLYWQQKITIETLPETEVRLKVTYANGSLNNSGTKNGYSDKNGKFTSQWVIRGKKDIIGIANVEVSAGSLETYSQKNSQFEITEYKKPVIANPVNTPLPIDPVTNNPTLAPNSP